MKKRITRVLSLILAVASLMATCAMAANAAETYPTVRVNGAVVEYPDAQPYVDENGRTMIPVRFVTEELGADVKWDGSTHTASISRNGIKVDITIGSTDLKVTRNGKTETVKMDTAAVLKDGRTYVPIRYVAEALGAYVDYADAFKVVGIYLDKLSADEISELREYGYTTPDGGFTYEEYLAKNGAKQTEFYYGTYRNTFGNFANSHEYLYHRFTPSTVKYTCDEIGETLVANDAVKFYETMVREAAAELAYSSERMTVEFKADTSCVHQADCHDGTTATIRGYLCIKLHVNVMDLTTEEKVMLGKLQIKYAPEGELLKHPVDVHLTTLTTRNVEIRTIVHLDADN